MKILIEMNLPPRWVQVFASAGCEAVHWSQVGAPTASDREIMAWARKNGYVKPVKKYFQNKGSKFRFIVFRGSYEYSAGRDNPSSRRGPGFKGIMAYL